MNNLENKLQELRKELRDLPKDKISKKEGKTLIEKIEKVQHMIYMQELKNKVSRINKEHAEFREFIKDFLKVTNTYNNTELIDLITNSGKLHKTKIKKYPILVEFIKKYPYVYFDTDYNGKQFRVRYNRREFFVHNIWSTEENKYIDYTKPEQMYKWFGIIPKDLTVEEVYKQIQEVKEESKRFKKQIEEYKARQKDNNVYFLENNGFVSGYNFNSVSEYV